MTVQAMPWSIQGQNHSAEVARNATAAMFGAPVATFTAAVGATAAGGAHGVVGSGDLAVTQNGTPNMTVLVAAGRAIIRSGGTSSILQGCYALLNDATVSVTISAADATNPRIDLIVAQVRDSNYGEAAADARIVAITGTPAASPAVPALTAYPNCIVLAQVAVAANATSITNANITDKRTRASALGGTVPCTSTTRPSGAARYDGLTIFETDTYNTLTYYAAAGQWRKPWNMPWGNVGSNVVGVSMSTGVSGAMADLSGLSVTFTAIANRYYKVSLMISNMNASVAMTVNCIIADAGGTQLANIANQYIPAGASSGISGVMFIAPAGGSYTVKARATNGTATAGVTGAGWTNWIAVEDIGPNGAPA